MIRQTFNRTNGPRELDAPESQRLMTVLDDERGAALLAALAETDDPLTVNELSERCDVPLSTVYRKIDGLDEVGVVDQHTELRNDGKHTSSYSVGVDHVEFDLTAHGFRATVHPVDEDEERSDTESERRYVRLNS